MASLTCTNYVVIIIVVVQSSVHKRGVVADPTTAAGHSNPSLARSASCPWYATVFLCLSEFVIPARTSCVSFCPAVLVSLLITFFTLILHCGGSEINLCSDDGCGFNCAAFPTRLSDSWHRVCHNNKATAAVSGWNTALNLMEWRSVLVMEVTPAAAAIAVPAARTITHKVHVIHPQDAMLTVVLPYTSQLVT